ncbi:MAG: DNA topoisomerase I [Desulfobacterales bacterium]|nr:DNA topoisomerase I [Desulfobacterales bacterium]
MSMGSKTNASPEMVRQQLDEILARQIIGKLDVDFDTAMMSFNLSTISCVVLIVEREKEIKEFADSPPERYDLPSFYKELSDIGLDHDAYLEMAVDSFLGQGYMSKDDQGELKAQMPAFIMAGLLDNMFPGMQGMNLVAFVLQMNDEVNSGRKSLELARQSFESTLESRSVAVTQAGAQKKATEIAAGKSSNTVKNREVSRKLKQENLNRLSKLMKSRKKRDGYTSKMLVKDVFEKGPTKEELEAQKEEARRAEEEARKAAELAKQLAQQDEKIKEAEEAAREAAAQLKVLEEKEAELQRARESAAEAEKKAEELAAKEAQMAEREAQLKAMEDKIRQEEERVRLEQEKKAEEEAKKAEAERKAKDEDDIESQIAAFENDLAMPCPLCSQGKIISSTTGKGKEYYSCNRSDCRFVSWDKPYHFPCPLCRNPFLTEAVMPTGDVGLKCPRASCSYTQNNLMDPKVNMAGSAGNGASGAPKKKKRVVRRKKRR